MEQRLLKRQDLDELFDKLAAAGRRIVAPRKSGEAIVFEDLKRPDDMTDDYVQTTISAKAAVFPRYELLLRYRFEDKEVRIEDEQVKVVPTVIFGLRPCDARSFAVLNAVFTWDYQDVFFKTRLDNTAVIAMSCTKSDPYCFCTSVGGSPGGTEGSDILLTPLGNDEYLTEIVTEKGRQIIDLAANLFTPAKEADKARLLADVPVQFEITRLAERLPEQFKNDAIWAEQSMRCLGCGACAFLCPACVCFDIQDEANREGGVRLRCWDSCGLSLFTLHTSGHNPRSTQGQRWRQRIMHKFSYFQDRLGYIACVGCGRCSRSCPADMNLAEHLKTLAEAS
jgi:formate hydrogenlyase subunit 6/NADH:ubiquinone oxidoreductase subunit I